MLVIILVIILMIIVSVVVFVNFSPQFGGTPSDSDINLYQDSKNYKGGVFVNYEEVNMDLTFKDGMKVMYDMSFPNDDVAPKKNVEVVSIIDDLVGNKPDSLTRLTWFGHSSFLLEIDNLNILIDPVLSDYASPTRLFGKKRYNEKPPITISDLPSIDLVIISHDHYDHLDYETILEIKSKTAKFFVPFGVAAHLKRWGIEASKITEFDWWDEVKVDSMLFVFAPAQHFSGRGITNRASTLWGSWIIKGSYSNIFFSGDSGYGTHFKEIGEKYGPFDLGLLECGQYSTLWSDIHMMPEETVQAGFDVQAKLIQPIHWGAFTLALHSWTEPVERFCKAAKERNIPYATPQVGEPLIINDSEVPTSQWWRQYE